MDLPIFITLHALAVTPDHQLAAGDELVINAEHIAGMFPAEAREENGPPMPCTMISVVGLDDPIHVVESPQDVCDLILRAVGIDRPSAPTNPEPQLPLGVVENPWGAGL